MKEQITYKKFRDTNQDKNIKILNRLTKRYKQLKVINYLFFDI
jgi:hypothetical protein